jgi:hypothetical protein
MGNQLSVLKVARDKPNGVLVHRRNSTLIGASAASGDTLDASTCSNQPSDTGNSVH